MNSNVTSCPICAQNKTHTKGERIKGDSVSYDMWQCEECGSEFAMPRQAASSEYYEYETPVLRWEFEVVAKYLAENNIQTNVLDVGCADGSFVGLLRAYGIEAQGIDFNKDKIESARAKGLNCRCIDVRAIPLEQQFYAITAFHVLEHLEEPEPFLKQLRDKLKNDSLLFLSFPNVRRFQLYFRRDDPDYPPNLLSRISDTGMISLIDRTDYELLWRSIEPVNIGWLKAMSLTANRLLDLFRIRKYVKASRLLNPPVKLVAYLMSLPWVFFWQFMPVKREGYTAIYCLKKKS